MKKLRKRKGSLLAVSIFVAIFLVSCKGDEKVTENQISEDAGRDNSVKTTDSSTSITENRKLEITVTNYSYDKPCWKRHGMIRNVSVHYGVSDGLESPDIIFPENITEGMEREKVIASLGKPDSEKDDYIEYEETEFSLDIGFDDNKVNSINYKRSSESAMKVDDVEEIKKTLDQIKESSVVKNSFPSDNLKDMEIKIGKKVYAMPVCASDLVELGYGIDDSWVMNPDTSDVPKDLPGIFYPRLVSDKKGKDFYVAYENSGKTLRSIANCHIASLTITEESEKCSIARGIHIGSGEQEVLEAFGKKKLRMIR